MNTRATILAYYSIANPCYMFVLTNICTYVYHHAYGRKSRWLVFGIFLIMGSIIEPFLPYIGNPTGFFWIALIFSSIFQLVNVLGAFVHGPNMKILCASMVDYEGRFEASAQICFQFMLLFAGPDHVIYTGTNTFSMFSSLAMLSVDLSYNILGNCNGIKFESLGILEKMWTMKKIIPALLFNSLFRLGTLSLIVQHLVYSKKWLGIIAIRIAGFLPVPCLLWSTWYRNKLRRMSLIEIWMASTKEFVTFSIWGCFDHLDSRWFQLVYQIYFSVIYGIFCLWYIFNPYLDYIEIYAFGIFISGWIVI